MSIVEVRPLPVEKWHGKDGKDAFAQPKTIQVLYDHETGKYKTGLTPEEASKWGVETGLDLSDRFIPGEEHPYWSTSAAQIKLLNNTMFFNTEKVIDRIKVKNLRASKFVANSMKEWKEGKWPDATHVIFDESEEADVKASKIEKRKRATKLADKMTLGEKINMVLIIDGKFVKNKTPNFIEVALDDAIENDIDKFLQYAEMDSEDLVVRGQIEEALYRQTLTREGNAIYYMGERIGFDKEEAIQWFKNDDNQKLKVAILEKLNS